MARIRTIKPEFWTNEQVMELSPLSRLLFIGLWNFCDDRGVHPVAFKTLKAEVFPADDLLVSDIERLIGELIGVGLLDVFESDGRHYWFVTGWNHQVINRPTKSRFPEPPRRAPLPSAAGQDDENGGENAANSMNGHGGFDDENGGNHGALTESSLRTHGALTEDSRTEGKGSRSKPYTPPSLRSGGGEISVEISPVLPVDNQVFNEEPEPHANGKPRLICPYQRILALYDKHLPMCPRVMEWTDTRKRHLSALWHRKAAEMGWKSVDEGLEYFDGYFAFVASSPFLTGRVDGRNGKPPFVANLEWLVTPSRFANIVEGKYHA